MSRIDNRPVWLEPLDGDDFRFVMMWDQDDGREPRRVCVGELYDKHAGQHREVNLRQSWNDQGKNPKTTKMNLGGAVENYEFFKDENFQRPLDSSRVMPGLWRVYIRDTVTELGVCVKVYTKDHFPNLYSRPHKPFEFPQALGPPIPYEGFPGASVRKPAFLHFEPCDDWLFSVLQKWNGSRLNSTI